MNYPTSGNCLVSVCLLQYQKQRSKFVQLCFIFRQAYISVLDSFLSLLCQLILHDLPTLHTKYESGFRRFGLTYTNCFIV
jgi:hypothetical protein